VQFLPSIVLSEIMRVTRAIIHVEHFIHNIRLIRNKIGRDIKMCVAVKADAYGHGAIELARQAVNEGVEFLGVATAEEGSELVHAGVGANVLLLSIPAPDEIPLVVRDGIVPIISMSDSSTSLNGKRQGRAKSSRFTSKSIRGWGGSAWLRSRLSPPHEKSPRALPYRSGVSAPT